MNVHLIAVGGSAMHNMAIALHQKGFNITGSDDQIFEPSKSRLLKHGLLPKIEGWNPDLITSDLDAVILGMHAKKDNPELLKAKELKIPIYSYPEYIFNQSKNKKRVVIGGSHGKTSITSMILHVLKEKGLNPDFMVGAQLAGFDTMVKLTKDAEIIILEGDEYLSSPIDLRPKFHWYKPHIAVLSGIAWDHINVFPTFENYVDQFKIFKDSVDENGVLFYCESDNELLKLCKNDSRCKPYNKFKHIINNGITSLIDDNGNLIPIKVFGDHNLQNLSAAYHVCLNLRVTKNEFFKYIQTFKGASKRLELISENSNAVCYKDFAHSPSKLKATTEAMKNQFKERKLTACMELHTFSSLTSDFLKEYKGCIDAPDEAIVYFSLEALKHKNLPEITEKQVFDAFDRNDLKIFTDSNKLKEHLKSINWTNNNLLIMTSGNFSGINIDELGKSLIN